MRKVAVLIPLMLLGAAPPASPLQQPKTASPIASLERALPECQSFDLAAVDGRAAFHRLGDLPSANAYKAVLRAGPDGCPDPVIASYGHGSPTGPTPARRR